MLVVYGVRRKVKIDKELGPMTCTNCGHNVNASLAHEGGYVHMYYIPIAPYFGGAKIIACPNCGIMRAVDKNEFKAIKNS